MKFVHAKIYGFAKWHDFQFDFYPSELQVVYGENESGKSSLQQFILFILFGLPPKKREVFRSKTSGKMGGMLTVVEEEIGAYTIERIDEVKNGAAKCLLPNGEETDEEWLKNRLHGMTRQTYQSIFSFDQLDLTSLKTMKEEDLGEILLGIGLTGSTDIYTVEKLLDSKIGELFKPTGKKPIINQQLGYVDDLYNKVQEFKSKEKTYHEKKDEVMEINKDMEGLQDTIQVEKEHVTESEKIRQALPSLNKLTKTEAQLNSFPNTIPFPEEGMKRWEAVKEKLLPLESELAVIRNNALSYQTKLAELKELLMDPETYGAAKQLVDMRSRYNDQVKKIKTLESTIKEQEISLENELKNIDTKLEPTDLNDISLTYQAENIWNQVYAESQQLRIDKENLNHEKAVQQKQKEELERTLHTLDANSLSSRQIDELTNRIGAYTNFQHQEKENVQNATFKAMIKQKQKLSVNLLVGSIILAIVIGLFGVFQGYSWSYSVMVIFLGVGITQWILGKQSIKTIAQFVHDSPNVSDDVIVTLEEKEEAEELLASHDEQLRQRNVIDEKRQTNKIERIKWQERYSLTMRKADRKDEKIKQQRESYPILQTIDVDNWPSFYHTFKSLLQNSTALNNNREQLNGVEKEKSNLKDEVFKFFTDNKWELKYKTVDTCFTILQENVVEHGNTLRLIEQYKTWLETTNEQTNTAKQKLHVFQAEQMNLMEAAKVKTEEQFYQGNTLLEEKMKTKVKKEELVEQLGLMFSDDKIRELLSSHIDIDIEERQKEYRNKLEIAEQELEEKRKLRATLDADLANMESSDEHSQTIHRYEMENAKLKKLVDRWVVLKSAKEMLVETKNKYWDKYMGRIIEQTADFFAIVTNNTYTNVYAPTKDQVFQVESADQLRFTVNELSQGTKDQLYIALRIAISEVMSDTHHMPFIIDDAFVHFDEIRVENMMRLIAGIAKRRQVLLFTCKKEVIMDGNANNVAVLAESIRNS